MEKIFHLWQQLFNKQTPWNGSSSTIWTKGSGTETNPYQIETAEHLAYLTHSTKDGTNYEGKHFKLINNLDLGKKQWAPIGLDKNKPFRGNFDGNGKTIANLYIKSTTLKYAGLFGYIEEGEIKNLGIIGESSITISSSSHSYYSSAGGIVGFSSSSSISNCYNTGKVSSSDSEYPASDSMSLAGGIAGVSSESSISNCYNTGNVSSSSSSSSCYSSFAGGIAGNSNSIISNCYNTGKVSSSSYTGGIAGMSDSLISNCYNTGSTSSCFDADGIAGNSSTEISNCYKLHNMVTINGETTGNGNENGTVKISEEMKTADFVKLLNSKNETTVWLMDSIPNINNGYPIIKQTR